MKELAAYLLNAVGGLLIAGTISGCILMFFAYTPSILRRVWARIWR